MFPTAHSHMVQILQGGVHKLVSKLCSTCAGMLRQVLSGQRPSVASSCTKCAGRDIAAACHLCPGCPSVQPVGRVPPCTAPPLPLATHVVSVVWRSLPASNRQALIGHCTLPADQLTFALTTLNNCVLSDDLRCSQHLAGPPSLAAPVRPSIANRPPIPHSTRQALRCSQHPSGPP